jgi:hypothetical protein
MVVYSKEHIGGPFATTQRAHGRRVAIVAHGQIQLALVGEIAGF